MKINTTRQALLDALLVVSRAVSARAALQALSGILLTVDGEARLARDRHGARARGRARGRGRGTTARSSSPAASWSRSSARCRTARSASALREAERDVEITAGSSRFHLRTLPADDFPRFPEAEGDPVELPAAPLRETINRVARAASRDEARPVLTGVLVTVEGEELTMVATDSYRLAVKHDEARAPSVPERLEANVPARALRELARLIEAAGEDAVEVWLTRNQALFRVGEVSLSSRLIDGQFPNHRQLLPDSFEHEVKLPRAELLEVTRRVSQLAQRNAALRLSFSDGELVVSAETPDLGDAREALPGPVHGRAARDRLQPGVRPRRAREHRLRRGGAEADLPAAPGPDRAGRRRRLQLPGDADSPQRLGTAVVGRAQSSAAGFATSRTRASSSATRITVVHGPNGAGKTQPARGHLLRPHRALLPHRQRPGPDPLRRAAGARVELDLAGEGDALLAALDRSRRAPPPARRPRRSPDAPDERPLVERLPPDRLQLVKGAPAHRRAHLDRLSAALWPARAELRQRFGRTLAQRNALVARVRAGLAAAGSLAAWDERLASGGRAADRGPRRRRSTR